MYCFPYRNSDDAYQTSVELNHSSPEVEKTTEDANLTQTPYRCAQCSTVFGYKESLSGHDCPALSSLSSGSTMPTLSMANSAVKQNISPLAGAASAQQSKRYSAAPKSVLEKRKKETNGVLSSNHTAATSIEETPKRSSISRRKKKSECTTEQPLPVVAQKPVACAVCSVRGFRLEYSTREELALHMLEEHRCIYICNRWAPFGTSILFCNWHFHSGRVRNRVFI